MDNVFVFLEDGELRKTANLTTDVKMQKQELLQNVVLDLQVCGDQGMWTCS